MLVVLVAAVGVPLGVHRRWETFRQLRLRHENLAMDYARLADTCGRTADDLARAATLAETMAVKMGGLLGAEPVTIAEGDRHREREARDQERSYRAAMEEEMRRANEFRRW